MNRFIFTVGILTLAQCLPVGVPSAFAFHAAKISADPAEVKDAPSDDSLTKSTMPKGTRVNTSNLPTNGYYRVRSASDSGWVRDSDLEFSSPQNNLPPPPKHHGIERMEDGSEQPDQGPKWSVKAFGGMDFWKVSDVTTLVKSTALENGGGFGGEVDYFLWGNFGLALRLEKLSKTSTGTTADSKNVSFDLSSTPLMVGIDWQAASGENFSLDLGGYLGEGLSTQITETDESDPSPNVTQMSASAPTFLLAADLNWHITHPLWLFAEAGYRYLKTSQNSPNPVGAGNLFTDSNGNATPFAIDLSGPVLNFGVRVSF